MGKDTFKIDNYFFIHRDEKRSKKYDGFYKITDIFPVNSVGIVTARDGFVINDNKENFGKKYTDAH